MFTGLSTAAGPIVHTGASSGACLIAGFVRTSTGQGTRGSGNPGRPGPPANRPGSPTRRFGRSSDRNVRQAGSRLRSSTVFGSTADRRTGSGSTDDAAQSAERRRPGARRDTADRPFGFARNHAQAEVQTRTAKSNPDLARGRRARVRPGRFVPSLNSGGVDAAVIAAFPRPPSAPKPDPCLRVGFPPF